MNKIAHFDHLNLMQYLYRGNFNIYIKSSYMRLQDAEDKTCKRYL